MKHPMISGLAVLVTSLTVQGAEPKTGPDSPAAEKTYPSGLWRSELPTDCPFKPSTSFTGIEFTGRHSDYRCGDTFYPSWASDGNLYSPWTDGKTDGVVSQSGKGANAQTGHAVMIGDDPLKLEIRNTSAPKVASALPYHGRYPAGSLVYNDIWYYGTYCLGPEGSTPHNGFTWNWPNLGPMPGFQISRDFGKTWEPSPHSEEKPLFPEPRKFLGPVKMGAPHFVDFGKNMEHSPDGKAYLARVTPSPETINDPKAYEFFAGHDSSGQPVWTRDFEDHRPLAHGLN